jgi:hypothetical protein
MGATRRDAHRGFRSFTIGEMLQLLSGKIRRFTISHFRKGYVRQQEAARKGQCSRCGACCKLLFRCPFLLEEDGLYSCRIHGNKPENCHIFPINQRDLEDRNIVSPEFKCGFYF